jgi:predicted Zn finger-like uncharacterized protein
MFPGVAMVSDPLTDGWYLCTRKLVGPMHIVCPNCSTSYAIEEASLGAAGRTVRCARCKTTWFASAHQPVPEMATAEDADAFTGVIRPDQTNASNEAPDLPPEASEHEQQPYRTTQRLQPPRFRSCLMHLHPCHQSNRRHIRMPQRIPMKSKTLPPAASGCRRGAGKPAPPNNAVDVMVRFVNAQDATPAAK